MTRTTVSMVHRYSRIRNNQWARKPRGQDPAGQNREARRRPSRSGARLPSLMYSNRRLVASGKRRDPPKIIGLEAGAADERAVHVGHGEQFRRVLRLDRPAIED